MKAQISMNYVAKISLNSISISIKAEVSLISTLNEPPTKNITPISRLLKTENNINCLTNGEV